MAEPVDDPPSGPAPPPALARRAVWGAADQGIYGLTNLALSLVVASTVSQTEFGAFSVVLIAYTLTNGMMQGLTSEVFTVVFSAADPSDRHAGLRAASGASLTIGLLVAAGALALSLVVTGPVGAVLVPFAAAVPALYLQDLWRFAFFATGRPRAAVANDLTWAAVQVVALVVVARLGYTSAAAFVWAWGAGALAGALLGLVQGRAVPQPTRAWPWVRDQWGLGGRFAGEFLTLYGSAQVVLAVLGATAGLAELARVRAAQVVFAPLQGVLNAVRLAVTSIAVDVRVHRPERLGRFTATLAAGLGTLAALVGAGALLLPDSIGEALLGDSWDGARGVLLPVSLLSVATAVSLGALTALRAVGAAHRSFRVRAFTAALVAVFGSIGAVSGGAVPAGWGIASAASAGAVLLAWQAYLVCQPDGELTRRVRATDPQP